MYIWADCMPPMKVANDYFVFNLPNIFAANYLDNWKCIAVLKGVGNPTELLGSSVPSGLLSTYT